MKNFVLVLIILLTFCALNSFSINYTFISEQSPIEIENSVQNLLIKKQSFSSNNEFELFLLNKKSKKDDNDLVAISISLIQNALAFEKNGNYEKFIDEIQQLEALITNKENRCEIAYIKWFAAKVVGGNIYYLKEAENLYWDAILYSEIYSCKYVHVLALYYLSKDIFQEGNYFTEAGLLINKAIDIINNHFLHTLFNQHFYHYCALRFYNVGEYQKSKHIFKMMFDYIPRMRMNYQILNNYAMNFERLNQLDSAEILLQSAHELAKNNSDEAWIGITAGNLSLVHYKNKNYTKALSFLAFDLNYSKKYNLTESYLNALQLKYQLLLKNEEYNSIKSLKEEIEMNIDNTNETFINPKKKVLYKIKVARLDSIYYNEINDINSQKETNIKLISLGNIYTELLNQQNAKVAAAKSLIISKESKVFELLKESKEKESLIRRQQLLLGISAFLLIVSLILWLRSAGLNRKLDETNKELRFQNNKNIEDNSVLLATNKELEISKISLEKLNETQKKFLSILSHDVKMPLNNLKGLNNLLISSSDLSKEYKEIAVSLNQQLEQTDNLINNLLHWIKNQHNVLEVNITKINLKELVIETKNLLQGNLVSKQLVFHNDVSNVAFVAADLELLRVVIRNILSNAVKFSPLEGEIFVSAYLQGQFFRMEIKDQGIGISEELLQKLFLKPIENALKKDYGTGLGLYLSFEFLQMMGGRIEVKSELGKGSTFILFLRVWEDLYQ